MVARACLANGAVGMAVARTDVLHRWQAPHHGAQHGASMLAHRCARGDLGIARSAAHTAIVAVVGRVVQSMAGVCGYAVVWVWA